MEFGLINHTLFWQNGTAGLLNRVDSWEPVASNVYIYLDDILEVDKKLIRLEKGDEIASNVILCGTGWDAASFDFFEPNHLSGLACPILTKTHHLRNQSCGHDLRSKQTQRFIENLRPPHTVRVMASALKYSLYRLFPHYEPLPRSRMSSNMGDRLPSPNYHAPIPRRHASGNCQDDSV